MSTLRALATFVLIVVLTACSGGGNSTTSPSASASVFSGTWTGSFVSGGVTWPTTLTLSQSGSAVTGIEAITTGPGVGYETVNGTVNGNTATVTLTNNGAVVVQSQSLAISGATLTMTWVTSNGATLTGTLTSGGTPASSTPAPGSGLTPTVSVAGTWAGPFTSATGGNCQWTNVGFGQNSPAITLVLKQSGSTVTGSGTTNLQPTSSSLFSCPSYNGYGLSVIGGVLSGNVLTFFDGVGSNWTLNFTSATAAGNVQSNSSFYLGGTVTLSKTGP